MAEVLPRRDPTILIATNSLHRSLTHPIAEDLTSRGYNVVEYEADKVAAREMQLSIQVDADGLAIQYDNKPLEIAKVVAAWYWRPNIFGYIDPDDPGKQEAIDRERRLLQNGIWAAIPERAWLNVPERMTRAENKVAQLALANTVGFNIPPTVVSNAWEDITQLPANKIVLKMPRGVLTAGSEIRTLYTKVFAKESKARKALAASNPYPGIWQTYLEKAREWRITAVGEETFDAAIYTEPGAKDDWRRHQHGPDVTFRHESFPDGEKQKCLAFLGGLGLRYGTFDFVESPDGRLTFLERNPNGQYGWLEQRLGLPISRAIANHLAETASAA